MEELIARCLQAYEETGDAGLRAFLEAHPDERAEIEGCLLELRAVGLLGATGDGVSNELGKSDEPHAPMHRIHR